MSRLLCQPELLRRSNLERRRLAFPSSGSEARAPIRNRTVDLLLTMETLYRLSYWGVLAGWRARTGYTRPRPSSQLTGSRPGKPVHHQTKRATSCVGSGPLQTPRLRRVAGVGFEPT